MQCPPRILDKWESGAYGVREPPPYVKAALLQRARYKELEGLNTTLVDFGIDIHKKLEALRQMKLELPSMDARHNSRVQVADLIDTKVLPHILAEHLDRFFVPRELDSLFDIPTRLRNARPGGVQMFRAADSRTMTIWDDKAGLPTLCPDDARDEANRINRRLRMDLERFYDEGLVLHYAVFTVRNVAPGKCRPGMRALSTRFRNFMRNAKRRFPMIKGAYAVMETPLGWRRDWHPHLNIIFVCNNYFDYGRLRAAWHNNIEVDRIRGGKEGIAAALREFIKYSVRTVAEKSHGKKVQSEIDSPKHPGGCQGDSLRSAGAHSPGHMGGGISGGDGRGSESSGDKTPTQATLRLIGPADIGPTDIAESNEGRREERRANPPPIPPAPPMIEWTAEEFIEWWLAHQKFRRSRGYGCLYRLGKPEKESLDGFAALCQIRRRSAGYWMGSPLLEFIPGDKSTKVDNRDRQFPPSHRSQGPPLH